MYILIHGDDSWQCEEE